MYHLDRVAQVAQVATDLQAKADVFLRKDFFQQLRSVLQARLTPMFRTNIGGLACTSAEDYCRLSLWLAGLMTDMVAARCVDPGYVISKA